jgi:hypothetical protein
VRVKEMTLLSDATFKEEPMASTQLNSVGGMELRDQIKQPIYDSIDITSTSVVTEERSFFSNTQGKSIVQSNLRGNGSLERNKSFRIMGMEVYASSSDPAKVELLELFSNYSFFQLWISEKQYWESPLRFLTGKIRQAVALAGDTDAINSYVQFGNAGCNPLALHGTQALDIGPLTTFYALWKVEGASAGQITKMTPSAAYPIRFVASLKGLLRRPVQ